jgi:acylphosphatase
MSRTLRFSPAEQPRLSATISPFVSDTTSARRYFVSGTVQGVGFRYFAQGIAQNLGLLGYVRNLPDGRVEAYAVGTPKQLASFRAALERGPQGASVSEVREQGAAIDPTYADDFIITFI